MIKNIIFDLGGVIITINHENALRQFKALGLENAEEYLDPYTQKGMFGDLEQGKITADDFVGNFSQLVGKDVSFETCRHAWLGYLENLPQRNLEALTELRQKGYRIILLSNTNPFMMSWAESDAFDGNGHSIHDYFDALYMSYKEKMMKPDMNFFRQVLLRENIFPAETLFVDDGPRNVAAASQIGIRTFCPENGADWTTEIYNYLK
ncbi:MAG: HAD family phosphatase [Prevotella sp.]|nr:HAD family phosphatase [Prevotella sp.]